MKIINIHLILILLLTTFSCEDTDYKKYDPTQINQLFFEKDSVEFIYGFIPDKDIDLELKINLLGLVDKEKNNAFTYTIISEGTTAVEGTHYKIPSKTEIEKDSLVGVIPIDFLKNNLIRNQTYTLIFELTENVNYKPAFSKKCIVNFGDKDIPAPVWWNASKVGSYTQEKFILFVDLFKQSEEFSPVIYGLIKNTWGENLDTGTATNLLTIARYLGYVKRYILEPMYEYYLETGDEKYEIPNPN